MAAPQRSTGDHGGGRAYPPPGTRIRAARDTDGGEAQEHDVACHVCGEDVTKFEVGHGVERADRAGQDKKRQRDGVSARRGHHPVHHWSAAALVITVLPFTRTSGLWRFDATCLRSTGS
jgi:hypothetical protein